MIASAFDEGIPYKWIDFPQPNYASSSADMIMQGDKMVGMSMFNGYSFNERCMLSLGVVDQSVEVGDVLTLIERAQENMDMDGAANLEKKLQEGDFNFEDFLDQHIADVGVFPLPARNLLWYGGFIECRGHPIQDLIKGWDPLAGRVFEVG